MLYGDALASGWQNWSWGSTVNLAVTSPVHAGVRSISLQLNQAWAALFLHTDTPVDMAPYSTLNFALRATQANQQYSVTFYNVNSQIIGVQLPLSSYGGNPIATAWKTYSIPIADFGIGGQQVGGLIIQDWIGQAQPVVYVDEIRFSGGPTPPSLTAAAAPAPNRPTMRVAGRATTNGIAVPQGTPVLAFAGRWLCGGAATTDAAGAFSFDVASASPADGCPTAGETLTYTVNGQPATGSSKFTPGGTTFIALDAAPPGGGPSPSPSPRPGPSPTPAPVPGLSPMQVVGTALLNGQAAPAGTTVAAQVGGVTCGSTTTTSAKLMNFSMQVRSASQQAGCGTNGAAVTFTINGAQATPTATFASGGSISVQINAQSGGPPVPTPAPTPTPPPPAPTPPPAAGLAPMQVTGTVTVGGKAQAGAVVQAFVNGVPCGQGTTTAAPSMNLSFQVASASQLPGCGTNGATVTFTVNGRPAAQTATFTAGSTATVNLAAQ